MTPISMTNQKAYRLGTGIVLVALGVVVLGVVVLHARFDAHAAFVIGVNVITGLAMIVFHRL